VLAALSQRDGAPSPEAEEMIAIKVPADG
jgi:hypothetical protein